jgi:hypothetical protein
MNEENPKASEPSPQPAAAAAPQASFSSLVVTLALSALQHLMPGEPDKDGKTEQAKPELAKQMIDMLEVLQEKTKGNLAKDEEELLNSALLDLRLRFLKATGEAKPEAAPNIALLS